MVYDCFMFFNELELLEIRLNELDSFVDKFVLVESRLTHSGKPKPLYYEENKDKFEKFNHKIIHIISESGNTPNPWLNDHNQRNDIIFGLKDCNSDDMIMFSDLDEIPNTNTLRNFFFVNELQQGVMIQCGMRLYYYYFNTESIPDRFWEGTKILRFGTFKESGHTFTELRRNNNRGFQTRACSIPKMILNDSGWHFSYIGGIDRVRTKMESFAHQELVNQNNTNPSNIQNNLDRLGSVWEGRNLQLTIVQDDELPEYIQENKETFEQFFRRS